MKISLRPTLLVLLMATFTGTLEQAAGLEGGADGYIARPVSNRELLARIESLLRLKRSEDRLQESEAKFRALTEMTAIFIVEPGGRILYANPAVALLNSHQARRNPLDRLHFIVNLLFG